MSGPSLTEAGSFGKPHGIKGEIAAAIEIDGVEIMPDDFVFANIDGLEVPFRVLSVRYKGAGYLLTLKGIDNEKQAAMLANRPLLLEEGDIAEGDEDDGDIMYLEDLAGFTITDRGRSIGVVEDYTEPTPHNPLFVVRTGDGDEILVPASEDLIIGIDTDNKTIDMNLPEGLVDLNSSK